MKTKSPLFGTLALAVALCACQTKTEEVVQEPVAKVLVETVINVDTAKVDSSLIEKPKVVIKNTANDKYFLIAGSFAAMQNAEAFKLSLETQGFNSQVIERQTGPNVEFYKVSYQSFSDKGEAFAALNVARNQEMRNDVWLLIKQ